MTLMFELMTLKNMCIWGVYIPFVGYMREDKERGRRDRECKLIVKGLLANSSLLDCEDKIEM